MNKVNQEIFVKAWYFASKAHKYQKMPGSDLPYLTHIGSVAMEILLVKETIKDANLAVNCAILHDTIEDTNVTYDDIVASFSKEVADGVLALTKNTNLPTKQEQMIDSLKRIKEQPKSVWAVKIADRISNLQEPPHYWTKDKIKSYYEESKIILEFLKGSNKLLEDRLREKIRIYKDFIN